MVAYLLLYVRFSGLNPAADDEIRSTTSLGGEVRFTAR
jgi:hypothetical protein